MDGKVRLVIEVPPIVKEKLHAAAFKEGSTIRAIVIRLLCKYLSIKL